MGTAFAQFEFVRVIFSAALVAIVLQCVVYGVRHLFGLKAAWIVLRASLVGFLAISVIELVSASRSGDLKTAIGTMGWSPFIDFAMFIVLTMFISYFMGDRYLADQSEREARKAASAAGAASAAEAASARQDTKAEPAEKDQEPSHA